ncbi:type II secretion system F family protein [Agromyces sp. NPDC057679]|uniref:type II secretion system F family protein n=1 Tax=Agromyces sp. NPDC057679 TaxID=3346207 RepID=UPI00366F1C65
MTDALASNPYETEMLRGRRASENVIAEALDYLSTLLLVENDHAALTAAAARFNRYDIGRSFARAAAGLELGTMTLRQVLAAEPVIPMSVRRLVEYDNETSVAEILAGAAGRIQTRRPLERRLNGFAVPGVTMLVAAAALLWIDATFIVPEYVKTFEKLNSDVPSAAGTVLDIAAAAQPAAAAAALFLLGAALILNVGNLFAAFRNVTQRALFLVPALGQAVKLDGAASFLTVLGQLLRSGASPEVAIAAAGDAAGYDSYRADAYRLAAKVQSGEVAPVCLDELRLLPEEVRALLHGRELDQRSAVVADRAASKMRAASDEQLETFARTVEPFGMFATYSAAILIVVAAILPLFAVAPAVAGYAG